MGAEIAGVAPNMHASARPFLAQIFVLLLVASGLFMAWLGLSAAGYFVPALCLLLQALLLWLGRGLSAFTGIMLVNQAAGLVLILVLWLGDGLGHAKLDISGVSLLLNLLCGGPLMSVLAIPLLALLHFDAKLPAWFQARAV